MLLACKQAAPYEGLAPSTDTGGPRVVFDLRRAVPEVPFPNDLLARPDPGSPTGIRVNASLVAPSQLERSERSLLDQLDGFGTFASITVAFDKDLDVADLFARQNDADPTNDGVYAVDLSTGATVPLDFNSGRFPYELARPDQYFLNDPLSGVTNLLFPTQDPLTANFLGPSQADAAYRAAHGGVAQQSDDLLAFYERATRTLILRPVLPLEQERRYAVVLTQNLRGADGKPVTAPGSGINHPAQTEELRPLLRFLPAGVSLSKVAYAWAFTTQSTTRELEAIRAGLNFRGPLRQLALQFPAQVGSGFGPAQTVMTVLPEQDLDPSNRQAYLLRMDKLRELLGDPLLAPFLGSISPAEFAALFDTLKYVDYFVSASFRSPSFLDAQDGAPQDATFQIDLQNHVARAVPKTVTFLLAVPKRTTGHRQPFPTVLVGHGYGGFRLQQLLAFAGTFAKFGLASIAIDHHGHGLGLDARAATALRLVAAAHGVDAFAKAMLQGLARDLDNDGVPDPGGDFFTGDVFHSRDAVRQSLVDWIQLVRILRSFDGFSTMSVGPATSRAGDFDGDGVPDVAGTRNWRADLLSNDGTTTLFRAGDPNPGSDLFAFGVSLGGILSAILPAVEPEVTAAAPVSGGGGLSDVAIRSRLLPVVRGVFLETLGPILANCAFSQLLQRCEPGAADAQPTLILAVQRLNREQDIPIAPLSLAPGDRVTVRNLSQTPKDGPCAAGCATQVIGADGLLRLPVAADGPTLATGTAGGGPPGVTVVRTGDPLVVTVAPASGAAVTVDTFRFDTSYFGVRYAAGSTLVSPARGFGLVRNTPELRRRVALSQMILDPADPINYASRLFAAPLAARAGSPAPTLFVGTAGDTTVPIATAVALARAAGIVEMSQPDPDYGTSMDQVLLRARVIEGVAGLSRFASPTYGPRADPFVGPHVRCDAPASCTQQNVPDPGAYACDTSGANCVDGLAAPRLNPPLRQQLTRAVPLPDGTTAISALLLPYLGPDEHGFRNPQPAKQFNIDQFLANLIGRYFETRGRELNFDRCQAALSSASPGGCPWIPPPPP